MTELGAVAAKILIEELIKKSLPSLFKAMENIKEDTLHKYNSKFTKYLEKEYEYLNNSTSQLFRNTKYQVSKLYIPLTLVSIDSNETILVDKFPKKLFANKNKILIKDTAGMGKSTLLKMIFRYSIDEKENIPFYIDLKSLIKEEKVLSVIDSFIDNFPSFTDIPSEDFLKRIFEKGSFIFLFDGADEVGDTFKEKVFSEINKFIKIAFNSKFIVATREEEKIISSFNHLVPFRIKELKKEEAYNLIRKYDPANEIAESLIQEINKKENETVFDFLVNPLLTTLLFTAYFYNKKIPLKKNLFYKQVYESLFENHDSSKIGYLSREKTSGLDIDDFEKVLGHFSYIGRFQEKLEYTKDELIDIFHKINDIHPSISFCAKKFLNDIVSRVPVLRLEGTKYIWQHKSIQEYFFVRFFLRVLTDEQRNQIINKILDSNEAYKFRLVFDILFDEDNEYFHRIFTIKLYDEISKRIDVLGVTELNIIDTLYKYVMLEVKVSERENDIFNQVLEKIFINEEEKIDFEKNFRVFMSTTFPAEEKYSIKILVFTSKYDVILEILNIKKYDFIYTKEVDTLSLSKNLSVIKKFFVDNKISTDENISIYLQNLNSPSLEKNIDVVKSGMRNLKLIDYKEFKNFVENFKEKEKKKEQLITDYYINF